MTSLLYYRKKIERFIKELVYGNKLGFKAFTARSEPWVWQGTKYLASVIFTGLCIYYTIHHDNFFKWGIVAALAQYYIEWFVELVGVHWIRKQ